MSFELDFTDDVREFQREIGEAQKNLNLFNEIQNLINAKMTQMNNDTHNWNLMQQSVRHFGKIMNKFNSDVDMVFADFNNYGADEKRGSIDMQHRTGDNKCQITHIVDAEKCICYAIDVNGEVVTQLKTFWIEAPFCELQPVETFALDDVFGIEIDSKLNRAKFVFDTTMNPVRARLIDTGEIIDIGDNSLQKLPNNIKSLPAAAFRCKINQIITPTGGDEAQSLADSVKGQIFDYQIRRTDENNGMLLIDIYTTNPFLMGFNDAMNERTFNDHDWNDDYGINGNTKADHLNDDVNLNLQQTINETDQRKWNVIVEKTSKKLPLTACSIYNTNYDLNDNTLSGFRSVENQNAIESPRGLQTHVSDGDGDGDGDVDGDGGAASLELQQTFQTDGKSMSNLRSSRYKRQTNIINGSSQACRNDQRHHNSNTSFETVRPMKTQCETTVVKSYHRGLKVPRVAEQITIIPTCVLNAREFYGQLGTNFNALQYSQRQLNNRRLRFENVQYSQLPDNTELVLVLLENGYFHRAEVLNASNNQPITIFLVDYGTTHKVELHRIYKWTPNCDKFPFFAVHFTLANVQIQQNNASMNEFVQKKIPKTFTAAEVTKIDDNSIFVRIFDDNGFDIGEEINCFSMEKINNTNIDC